MCRIKFRNSIKRAKIRIAAVVFDFSKRYLCYRRLGRRFGIHLKRKWSFWVNLTGRDESKVFHTRSFLYKNAESDLYARNTRPRAWIYKTECACCSLRKKHTVSLYCIHNMIFRLIPWTSRRNTPGTKERYYEKTLRKSPSVSDNRRESYRATVWRGIEPVMPDSVITT